MSSQPLYKYPKQRHRRTENPEAFSRYQDFRPYLISEFSNTCVYCRTPDFLPSSELFGIDHYLPKKQFPSLESEYSNLFLACNRCNRRKGICYPRTIDDSFIPNPCDHVMFDPLRYEGGTAKSHSHNGAFAIEQLLLNDPESLQKRETVMTLATALMAARDKHERMVIRLAKLAAAGDKSAQKKLPVARAKADELAISVRRFTGDRI